MHNKHARSINQNAKLCSNRYNVRILFYEQAVYEKGNKNGKKSSLSSLASKFI